MHYEADRVMLHEVTLDDLVVIHRLHSCPEVDEFNTLGIPRNLDDTKQYLMPLIQARDAKPRKLYFWKIVLRRKGAEFIGIAGMTVSADKFRRGEIYYKLLPNYWGKGYATEVSTLLLAIGFDKFDLHRVEAGVATKNIRSINVLEKIGMKREGLHRKILPIRGEWKDNYHYAMVKGDRESIQS